MSSLALEKTGAAAARPAVTVMLPVYNEAASIERCLEALLCQDYPAERVEVLIADGGSGDGTVERVARVAAAHPERCIRLFANPRRNPGAALNLMVREARGEVLIRMDGHAEPCPTYVGRCVRALATSDALNVGGCIVTSGSALMGGAIAAALRTFWGNGGARYRRPAGREPLYVDTVPFGAWSRDTLRRLGPFVEGWRVNEDCEFNARIRAAGGRVLLDPEIRATYYPRRSLGGLIKQYYEYGRGKCRVIARHPRQLKARQVAPPALVAVLALFAGAEAVVDPDLPLLGLASAGYLFATAAASLSAALQARKLQYLLVLPAVFMSLHLSYGLGALVGAGGFVIELTRRLLGRTESRAGHLAAMFRP